jgi:eukaryotic-like serine/threonine-protein kinase
MSPQEHDDLATALDGQYSIDREIGRGGMGVVYLAQDLRLDRQVAIKTLPPLLAIDAAIRERFIRH